MDIDYGRLRNVTAREMIPALNRDGFAWDHGDRSHQIYYHSDGNRECKCHAGVLPETARAVKHASNSVHPVQGKGIEILWRNSKVDVCCHL